MLCECFANYLHDFAHTRSRFKLLFGEVGNDKNINHTFRWPCRIAFKTQLRQLLQHRDAGCWMVIHAGCDMPREARDEVGLYILQPNFSEYAISWLLTPVMNAEPNSSEDHCNIAHRRIRSLIERTNGLLKMRFRCLLKHRVLHYKPDVASRIINSCVVLHNMCIQENVPLLCLEDYDCDFGLDINDNVNENVERNRINPELVAGRNWRRLLIQNMFTYI